MGHKERKKKNEKEEEATAEKDKADDEESQYSYITEDEDKARCGTAGTSGRSHGDDDGFEGKGTATVAFLVQ